MSEDFDMQKKQLVLVGGGHAQVYVLKHLGLPSQREVLAKENIQVTLIAKDVMTPYSGMLPGYIAGHYEYDAIHIDLAKLCRSSNIRMIHAACNEIIYHDASEAKGTTDSLKKGLCACDTGDKVYFDCLSINIGSAPSTVSESLANNPRVIPIKPISRFCRFYDEFRERVTKLSEEHTPSSSSSTKRKYTIGVVGGGAGAIETLLSIQNSLTEIIKQSNSSGAPDGPSSEGGSALELDMVLVTRGDSLLKEHNAGVRKRFKKVLQERDISVHYGSTVVGVKNTPEHRLRLELSSQSSNQSDIIVDECLLCTTASGAPWLSKNTPFQTDERGFLKVDSTYQVVGAPGVFAAGDCCEMVEHPRPKAGVYAVRAGPPLAENLMNSLMGVSLKSSMPQKTILGLISTGDKNAIASKGSYFSWEGTWVWKLKDYIDRTWMAQYTTGLSDEPA